MDMKIIIKFLWLSLIGIAIASCDKNDNAGPQTQKNLYRVKEISGHNAIWGDFKMNLQYENSNFEKGVVVNSQNDTVGKLDHIYDTRNKLHTYRVSVALPVSSPDGSGVSTSWLTVRSVSRDLRKEIISSYEYHNNEFKELPGKTYLYEYEDSLAFNPKVIKWRGYENQDDVSGLEKMTYSYGGEQIKSGEYAEYHTNWTTTAHYTYGYQDGRLVSLIGKTTGGQTILDKKFVYEGTHLKITTIANGVTREVTYTLNSEGYVTRIDEGNGNYMDVKYESGHGDFSYFIPLADKLEGDPYIK